MLLDTSVMTGLQECVAVTVQPWCKQRANKVPLPGKIPQQMVLDFASALRHDHFRASAGWLSSFKARHGIVARTISAEAAGVDVVATS